MVRRGKEGRKGGDEMRGEAAIASSPDLPGPWPNSHNRRRQRQTFCCNTRTQLLDECNSDEGQTTRRRCSAHGYGPRPLHAVRLPVRGRVLSGVVDRQDLNQL